MLFRWAGLLLAPLVLVACATTDEPHPNDIATTIPWEAPDIATYRVLDDDDQEIGMMEMSIEAEGADSLILRQLFEFPERELTNEAIVIADSAGLQPSQASFRIEGPDGNLTCDAVYAEGEVRVHRVGEDGERDDTEDAPDVIYDSWSDLFLWRTIDFREGYKEKYADSLSCTLDRTQVLNVELEIKEIEDVEVPAGTFEAWRLEIKSGGRTQKAWYSTADAHALIKYDNGDLTFELTTTE